MSDEEWTFLESFILVVCRPSGSKPTNHRLVLDRIVWVARTASPWRDLPEEFGKWSSVSGSSGAGRLGALGGNHEGHELKRGEPDAPQMIDSTIARAHHPLPGRTLPRKGDQRALKGGSATGLWPFAGYFTTKMHLLVDAAGLPMRAEITPGRTSDYTSFNLIMADNLPKPSVLLADRGYDADSIRKSMKERDVLPAIPMRKYRKMRVGVDRPLYRLQNLAERCFDKLKNSCRVANRYDTRPPKALSSS